MLNMAMPPYFLQTEYDGNGVYEAQFAFPMPGDWQVMAEVRAGAERRQFIFIVHID